VAAAAGVDRLAVALERVLAPTAARPHLLVRLQVTVGAELLKASELVKAVNGGGLSPEPEAGGDAGSHGQPGSPTISSSGSESIASLDEEFDDYVDGGGAVGQQASTRAFDAAAAAEEAHCAQRREERRRQLVSILGGDAIVALLGVPDPALCSGEVQDVTPACAGASEAARAQQDAVNRGDVAVGPQEDRRLALVSTCQQPGHYHLFAGACHFQQNCLPPGAAPVSLAASVDVPVPFPGHPSRRQLPA
jgi:hypothetical protein